MKYQAALAGFGLWAGLAVIFGTTRHRFTQTLGIPALLIRLNPVAVVPVAFRVHPEILLG